MDNTMEFLKRAERYAEARGDENYFREAYTLLREFNSVEDSVWKAVAYLYDGYVADLLELM
jgi:hypothetical protein